MTRLTVLALIVLLTVTACLPGKGSDRTLEYNGPTEYSVALGQLVPGTDIRYVAYSERGAEVTIGGQRALKKAGDSLDWKGTPVAGVDVALTQRILLINEQRLQTVGMVKVTINDVAPASAQFPDKPLYSYKVAVTSTVKRGATIPGTLITYQGKAENGAQLGGVSGYPYRKLGDSIAWTGRLRSNAYLDLTVRVVAYANDFVQVAGLATIAVME
jgi:hypothetical protein